MFLLSTLALSEEKDKKIEYWGTIKGNVSTYFKHFVIKDAYRIGYKDYLSKDKSLWDIEEDATKSFKEKIEENCKGSKAYMFDNFDVSVSLDKYIDAHGIVVITTNTICIE